MSGFRVMVMGAGFALLAASASAGGVACPKGEIADAAGLCWPDPAHIPLPRGYRPVWDDGRHNPHRAKGTEAGRAAMARLWTDDVPMRLVER